MDQGGTDKSEEVRNIGNKAEISSGDVSCTSLTKEKNLSDIHFSDSKGLESCNKHASIASGTTDRLGGIKLLIKFLQILGRLGKVWFCQVVENLESQWNFFQILGMSVNHWRGYNFMF